jgi:hypothetical protein
MPRAFCQADDQIKRQRSRQAKEHRELSTLTLTWSGHGVFGSISLIAVATIVSVGGVRATGWRSRFVTDVPAPDRRILWVTHG